MSRTLCECLLIFLLRDVEVVHVRGVMLAVVQLHDLGIDVGLQGAVVVGEVRQRVLLLRGSYLAYGLAEATSTPGGKKKEQRTNLPAIGNKISFLVGFAAAERSL